MKSIEACLAKANIAVKNGKIKKADVKLAISTLLTLGAPKKGGYDMNTNLALKMLKFLDLPVKSVGGDSQYGYVINLGDGHSISFDNDNWKVLLHKSGKVIKKSDSIVGVLETLVGKGKAMQAHDSLGIPHS